MSEMRKEDKARNLPEGTHKTVGHRLPHHWIVVNMGGERVIICEGCGSTFGETQKQDDPDWCYVEEM